MGWKETNVNEQVGKDGGPIETKDVSAIGIYRSDSLKQGTRARYTVNGSMRRTMA